MKKTVFSLAFLTLGFTIIFLMIYLFNKTNLFLTLTLSFGVTAYHFCMRLIVGYIFNILMKNKADYNEKWYQIHNWEKKLYKTIKVKKWKKHMPTFNPELFDTSKHSLDEIAQAMCQSELVHETIAALSFLPILLAFPFGDFPIFLITSIIGALIDICFVIMQRYNRPRIIKLIKKPKL